jgi:hypothetical protein
MNKKLFAFTFIMKKLCNIPKMLLIIPYPKSFYPSIKFLEILQYFLDFNNHFSIEGYEKSSQLGSSTLYESINLRLAYARTM